MQVCDCIDFHEDEDMTFSFLDSESARLRFPEGGEEGDYVNDDDDDMMSEEVFTHEFGQGPIGITFHDKRGGGFTITGCEGVAKAKGVRVGDAIVEINEQRLPADMLDDELYDMLVELPRPVSIGFLRFGRRNYTGYEDDARSALSATSNDDYSLDGLLEH